MFIPPRPSIGNVGWIAGKTPPWPTHRSPNFEPSSKYTNIYIIHWLYNFFGETIKGSIDVVQLLRDLIQYYEYKVKQLVFDTTLSPAAPPSRKCNPYMDPQDMMLH